MKRITLYTAALVLFAASAMAQQGTVRPGDMNNRTGMGQANFKGCGCGMNNRGGRGMQGSGMQGNAAQVPADGSNWRANPSYQGTVDKSAPAK